MFVTGEQDELVPAIQTKLLYEAARKSIFKNIFSVVNGTHNDTWRVGGELYKEKLMTFMRDAALFSQKLKI